MGDKKYFTTTRKLKSTLILCFGLKCNPDILFASFYVLKFPLLCVILVENDMFFSKNLLESKISNYQQYLIKCTPTCTCVITKHA